MKSKKTRTLLLVAGTSLALLGTACAGKFCSRDPEQHSAWLMEKVTDELELDSSQQARLKVFVDELTDGRKAMRSQRTESRQTIMSLLEQPTLDRDKSLSLVQGHIKTVNERAPKLVNSFADFYDILSPEQRQELREELDDHFDSHHGKHRW